MSIPVAVIITGPPSTGKTTLGQQIADALRLPFVSKDAIKEVLFDTLGWADREWSQKLGIASVEVLYLFVALHLRAGRSLVVENSFHAALASPELSTLQQSYAAHVVQVVCTAAEEIILERFKARVESGVRHPGHVDHLNYDRLRAALHDGTYGRLAIAGPLLEVDTTDWSQVDVPGLIAAIQASEAAL